MAVRSAGWDETTHPNQQTRQPPIYNGKYQCRIDTVGSVDDGQLVARNMHKFEINILRISVHLVGFI